MAHAAAEDFPTAQIERVLFAVARAPSKGIQRVPIDLTQLTQGLVLSGTGAHHD